MAYWLVKSEPSVYSFDQMQKDKTTFWSGVRNYQAANNMRAMKKGDKVFFYHSNDGKEIVGIVEVAREYYPDHTDKDGKFGMVDLKSIKKLAKPVTLTTMKTTPALKGMALIKQSRLSVTPITKDEWEIINKMAS
jgi:predicted RNA-binding protein with PUA-like domain